MEQTYHLVCFLCTKITIFLIFSYLPSLCRVLCKSYASLPESQASRVFAESESDYIDFYNNWHDNQGVKGESLLRLFAKKRSQHNIVTGKHFLVFITFMAWITHLALKAWACEQYFESHLSPASLGATQFPIYFVKIFVPKIIGPKKASQGLFQSMVCIHGKHPT